ncbi:MAG TPA: HAMP domain-containing sensor histidine kinase [Candidatus Binatus sp.]|jgi:two-component system sensor histidine kinase SenX3|nr:HAMP domain-containing sensor histidine kinase [Candidatus Binatus sp.]
MRIASRRKTIAFFLVLGISLVALAVALDVGWIILNWRQSVMLFLGVIVFATIILGMILNTTFLVREIRLNEQHGSFINAVTHELKTPITSIRLYLETLQRREVEEEQRQKFYELMLNDADRLLGTVEQVLKAGQVGYKRGEPYRAHIDLGSLAAECVDLARRRHHLSPEALRLAAANGQPSAAVNATAAHNPKPVAEFPVLGDPEELRTAISNVLDNAIKYSIGKVDVAVSIESPDDERIILRVRDRGVGIPTDQLKRVFKRFHRVRRRSTSKVKGTGLGLFIVRSIARAHGGKVYAESEGENQGTTVTLELPRSAA